MEPKKITDYLDRWSLVCTKEMDGGDTCAHHGAILYGRVASPSGDTEGVNEYLGKLEREAGKFVRHPDTTKWYSDLDRLSRDQMTPLLLLLGLMYSEFGGAIARLYAEHKKNWFLFAWNVRHNGQYPTLEEHQAKNTVDAWNYEKKTPDFTGPEIWACWIRALRMNSLYILLYAFDIQTLFGSIWYRYFGRSTLQMNHVLITDFSTRVMPTFVSRLARWIYGKKVGRLALEIEYNEYVNNPPVHQYLCPLIEGWKTRE